MMMDSESDSFPDTYAAAIELPDGRRVELAGDCRIGRHHKNGLQLPGDRVSREHAWIKRAPGGRFSVSDLGSRNGTWVNDQRVTHEVSLRDGDLIRIGDFQLTFRCHGHTAATSTTHYTDLTATPHVAWLLVADVAGFSRLSQQLAPSKLAQLVSAWRDRCAAAVRISGGQLNKQIGDGLLFHWFNDRAEPAAIAQSLDALAALQATNSPPFRVSLHHVGPEDVSLERHGGADELIGPQVNFVFRMDQVAKELGVPLLLTVRAAAALEGTGRVHEAGEHAVADFPGAYRFWRWEGAGPA